MHMKFVINRYLLNLMGTEDNVIDGSGNMWSMCHSSEAEAFWGLNTVLKCIIGWCLIQSLNLSSEAKLLHH